MTNVSNTQDSDYINSWVAESAVVTGKECHLVRKHKRVLEAIINVKKTRATIKRSAKMTPPPVEARKRVEMMDYLGALKALDETRHIDAGPDGEHAAVAFVTFNHMESATRAVKAYSLYKPWWRRCLMPRRLKLDLKAAIKVTRAPSPTDILWENLDVAKGSRFCRRFVTIAVASTILLLALLGSAGFNGYGNSFQEEYSDNEACRWNIPATFHNFSINSDNYPLGAQFPGVERNIKYDAQCQALYGGAIGLTYTVMTKAQGTVNKDTTTLEYSMDACVRPTVGLNGSDFAIGANAMNTQGTQGIQGSTGTDITIVDNSSGATHPGLNCPDPTKTKQCPCVQIRGKSDSLTKCPMTECFVPPAINATSGGALFNDTHGGGLPYPHGKNPNSCENTFEGSKLFECYCVEDIWLALSYLVSSEEEFTNVASSKVSVSSVADGANGTTVTETKTEKKTDDDDKPSSHPCAEISGLYLLAQFLDLAGDLIQPAINVVLDATIGWLALNVERQESMSEQTVRRSRRRRRRKSAFYNYF